jgi:hypothetical protein
MEDLTNNSQPRAYIVSRLPLFFALAGLILGGFFLIDKSDKQARDTIRKHHLQDIEQSLYFARSIHGTYPPYDQPSWCGLLNDPKNEAVRRQVEEVLRTQNEKYKNPAKPFPNDPLRDRSSSEALAKEDQHTVYDYFYWKRSPAMFELYAILEADRNGNRSTADCPSAPFLKYDYGINSVGREDRLNLPT